MASNAAVAGMPVTGKIRNPLAVIALSLVTLGIYGIYWYYQVNKELAEVGRSHNSEEAGTSPGNSLLAVTLGAFVIVPAFVSVFGTWKRLNAGERLVGLPEGMSAGAGFLLHLFLGPVGIWFLQSNLNKVLERSGVAAA